MADEENITVEPNAWSVACAILVVIGGILLMAGCFIGLIFLMGIACGNWFAMTATGILIVIWAIAAIMLSALLVSVMRT